MVWYWSAEIAAWPCFSIEVETVVHAVGGDRCGKVGGHGT